ncbi:MAG: M23 family metallopeptidase [Candidatus Hydrogenedentes bacterium]|nr:M23 family metallopeptidase [Candidatus Hydrogenedentota bacterium]
MQSLSALVIVFASFVDAADEAEEYRWPLDLPRVLTSSFAEYRPGRFHMGIDLRTGPIGKNVYAAADGYVSRIRCSPFGYGKAIYLKFDDGNSAVYAHLDDYESTLREYVRAAQHARKSYTVDSYPAANRFRVARGQLIAKSGQTGIGFPHLHYELRDRADMPIDPGELGVQWPDTTRPTIRKLLVSPGSPDSTVNGDFFPIVTNLRHDGQGGYTAKPIAIAGVAGFGIDVLDPANGGGTRLGVREVLTESNGREVFRYVNRRISYAHNSGGVVAYHPFFMDRGRFLLQWRWTGNRAESYLHTTRTGWLEAPSKPSAATITARDFRGNSATLTVPLSPQHLPISKPTPSEDTGTGVASVDCFDNWLVVTVQFTVREGEPPLLRPSAGAGEALPFQRIDSRTFRLAYDPPRGSLEAAFAVEHPRVEEQSFRYLVFERGASARTAEMDGVRMSAHPNTPYGKLFIRANRTPAPSSSSLRAHGAAYRLWHPSAPIDEAITISFPMPKGPVDPAKLRVYQRRGESWSMVKTTINGRFEVESRSLGTFAIMEDTSAPSITGVVPGAGSTASSGRPTIRARIADPGSGIDSYSVTYENQWLLTGYDPETELIEWESDEDLPPGEGELLFVVTDNAGNRAERIVQLTIPE